MDFSAVRDFAHFSACEQKCATIGILYPNVATDTSNSTYTATARGVAQVAMNGSQLQRVRFGPFEADLHTHELWKFGIKVKLVGQPFEVLAILLATPGHLVTRDELRHRLWPGDTYVDFNHGLNAAVNRLREALCDSADDPRYVETLPRRGYRFIAEIEQLQVGSAASAPAAAPADQPETQEAVRPSPSAVVVLSAPPVLANVASRADTNHPVETGKLGDRKRFLASGILLVVMTLAAALVLGVVLKKIFFAASAPDDSATSQRIVPLTTVTDETNEPTFSPDGNFVAFHRWSATAENSGIFVKGIASDQLLQLTSNQQDEFPAWSPDGQTVAYSRPVNQDRSEFAFYLVPLARAQTQVLYKNDRQLSITVGGMEERKIDTARAKPSRGEFDWSPDGKTLAFASADGILLLSLENHAVRRLTRAPSSAEDSRPSFSPDGKQILFIRGEAGTPDKILSVPTAGGEPALVTSDSAGLLSPARWLPDGRSIVFSSGRGSHPGLWRTSLDGKEPPAQINDGGWYPAISRHGFRMAYQRATRGLNIWELTLSAASASPASEPRILVPSTSQTDQGPGPQFSPDGKKLAYMSDHSGTMEIWVSDRDGGNPIQITALGRAGTPRWSPDSRWLAFDRQGAIYTVSAQGGTPTLVAQGNFDNECASWSADGKWVYFASSRTNSLQVWKARPDGTEPTQVTSKGGHAALESVDGKFLYYAKNQYASPEIWQVPTEGGAETLLSPLVRPASWASWAVVARGILFASSSGNGMPTIGYFDFATNKVSALGVINTVPFWLCATRDGKTVAFDQPGSEQDQVMLVENFH